MADQLPIMDISIKNGDLCVSREGLELSMKEGSHVSVSQTHVRIAVNDVRSMKIMGNGNFISLANSERSKFLIQGNQNEVLILAEGENSARLIGIGNKFAGDDMEVVPSELGFLEWLFGTSTAPLPKRKAPNTSGIASQQQEQVGNLGTQNADDAVQTPITEQNVDGAQRDEGNLNDE